MDWSNPFNPFNPLSPWSPFNSSPPTHETREHQSVPTPGVKIDLTVISWTLLGLVTLILAGALLRRWRQKRCSL